MNNLISASCGCLSVEQKAGQRIIAGFKGTTLNSDLKHLIDDLKVGGIILFSRNIEHPQQLKTLCYSMQEYASVVGQPPLLIAVDQEGGSVARLKPPFTVFPGNPFMNTISDVQQFVRITSAELHSVGINMNLAPVLDIASENSVMAQRAFSAEPSQVSRLGLEMIRQFQHHNIITCAKHFPGIGRTTVDSHIDLPVLNISSAELESYELIPFKDAINQGVDSVMISHVVYPSLDPFCPASLSLSITRDLLRNKIGYQGVILTDDLEMGAIKGRFELTSAVNRLLENETDIMLICHTMKLIETAFNTIITATRKCPELELKAEQSLKRLLGLKYKKLQHQHTVQTSATNFFARFSASDSPDHHNLKGTT